MPLTDTQIRAESAGGEDAPKPDLAPHSVRDDKIPTRHGRPTREEQARRHDVLLDVALDEFLIEGFGSASIETIARKAGVGKSTIYRNFETKQGLLLAVARRRMDELGERWTHIDFDVARPTETLTQIALQAYYEWTGKSLPIYRLIFSEAPRLPDLIGAVHAMSLNNAIAPVAAYFEKLGEAGVLSIRNAAESASMFLTMAVGGTRFLLLPSDLDEAERQKMARDAVAAFLYGCAVHRPT